MNSNPQQINQLKKIASITQNRYDDALRVLDQVKKERQALELECIQFAATIEYEKEALESERAELLAKMEHEKEALEQRLVEIENTRLNIPAETTTVAQLITTITKRSSRIDSLQSCGMNDEQMLLSFITMSDDEFDKLANPQNISRLQDFIKFNLTQSQREHIFGLSDDEYHGLKCRISIFEWIDEKNSTNNVVGSAELHPPQPQNHPRSRLIFPIQTSLFIKSIVPNMVG